eukprot:TRINITY_DN1116_c0_g1_i1.p1 TRINITY_DN1116_c0_g1~~TRINITY_DN1116_c0_g1_i1.p1  ORF type:complete len:524 (-),score=172.67 TRINITY_DN1116_c0_g1_i1:53-1549(-)
MQRATKALLTLVFVVCCAMHTPAQDLPGLKITLQQAFINELTSTLTPIIEGYVLESNLPDFSGVEHILLVGKVDWTISDIHMDSLDFTQDTLTINEGQGLQFKVTDGNGQFTCNWEWKRESGIIHASDSGGATVKFSKVSMDLNLAFSENGGLPTVTATSFKFDLGKLSISVSHGWTGWVYDFFLWLFNFIVKAQVESYIQSDVTSIINVNVTSALQALPTVVPIWSNGTESLGIDISMTSGPNFAASYVTIPYLGGIELNSQLPPYSPTTAMPDSCTNLDVNVLFNNYIFQSSAEALYDSGLLQVTLSPEDLPPDLSYVLNTTFWQFIIPNLYKHYPNVMVNVTLDVTSTPVVEISTDGFFGNATYNLDIFVPGTNESALTIGGVSDIQFLLYLTEKPAEGNVLHVNVSLLDTNLKVVNSNVGYVNLLLLNEGIAIIPLPSIEKVKLVDPNFFYFADYACMESNVLFNSSSPAPNLSKAASFIRDTLPSDASRVRIN